MDKIPSANVIALAGIRIVCMREREKEERERER